MVKFKTDFLVEDYVTLCWMQAKVPSVIMSLLLALAFGFTGFAIANAARLSWVSPIIGLAVFGICYLLAYKSQKKNIMKKAERRFSASATSDELELTITNEDITQVSNSGDTRLPWADVYLVTESKDSYYVYLTKRKAFYFPKRSFTSDQQKEEFLEYIRKYVPQKKIKIKD